LGQVKRTEGVSTTDMIGRLLTLTKQNVPDDANSANPQKGEQKLAKASSATKVRKKERKKEKRRERENA
jgi:hypothetical protein